MRSFLLNRFLFLILLLTIGGLFYSAIIDLDNVDAVYSKRASIHLTTYSRTENP